MENLLRFIHSSNNLACLHARWPFEHAEYTHHLAPATALDFFLPEVEEKPRLVIDHISPFPFPRIFFKGSWSPGAPATQVVKGKEVRLKDDVPSFLKRPHKVWQPKKGRALGLDSKPLSPPALASETLCWFCLLLALSSATPPTLCCITSQSSRLALSLDFSLPTPALPRV